MTKKRKNGNWEMDWNSSMDYSKKEGIKEGRAAGKKEGELKKARETAIILNQMNFPVEKIAEALQVQEDVIEEWIRENVVEFFRKNKE